MPKRPLAALAYTTLDLATLGVRSINGTTVRFPARWSRYYPRSYEPEKARFLRKHSRPGTLAVDVGAHIGLFSVEMARRVGPGGQVVSFEPNSQTRAVLEQVLDLNGLADRVAVREEAVAAHAASAAFYGAAGSNSSSLFPSDDTPDGAHQRGAVSIVALDQVLSGSELPLSCLKIDAEGAETAVLQGARELLQAHRPAVAIEVHPAALRRAGSSVGEALDCLQDLDLSLELHGAPVDREELEGRPESFELEAVPLRAHG